MVQELHILTKSLCIQGIIGRVNIVRDHPHITSDFLVGRIMKIGYHKSEIDFILC